MLQINMLSEEHRTTTPPNILFKTDYLSEKSATYYYNEYLIPDPSALSLQRSSCCPNPLVLPLNPNPNPLVLPLNPNPNPLALPLNPQVPIREVPATLHAIQVPISEIPRILHVIQVLLKQEKRNSSNSSPPKRSSLPMTDFTSSRGKQGYG